METVRLTTAQALVRFLENQYIRWDDNEQPFVKGVFLLPGHGNVVGLGQALTQEAKRLEVYQGKNEQGQAHVAVAFAKQRKRKQIFAVTSSVGPGAANMITAAATATANNIPVLLARRCLCMPPAGSGFAANRANSRFVAFDKRCVPSRVQILGPHCATGTAYVRHAQRNARIDRPCRHRGGLYRTSAGYRR